jgi:hypothetical protein
MATEMMLNSRPVQLPLLILALFAPFNVAAPQTAHSMQASTSQRPKEMSTLRSWKTRTIRAQQRDPVVRNWPALGSHPQS